MPEGGNIELGEPTWRVALFSPQQGGWTEAGDLALAGGPLVEYDDGCIEIKPIESTKAGIREYWVVDPESRTVTFHEPRGDHYEPIRYEPIR